MAEFSDEFARADEAIETGANWQAVDDTDDTSNVIRVGNARAVTNVVGNKTIAWYVDTVPTSASQEVEGFVVSGTQGSGIYVDLGVMGEPATAWSGQPTGVWVRMSWLDNGARRLSILRQLPGDAAEATVRTLDLVTAGSIPLDGYEGVMARAGALGERQWLRLIVTSVSGGLLARAYLNQDDDDRPTLTATIDRDLVTPVVAVTAIYGAWWFGFGDGSAASGDVALLGIAGGDYDVADDHEPQRIREDQPTLSVARERVRRHYEASTNTALLDPVLNDAITDTVEDLINLCGDACWFLVREEAVALAPDTNGIVTLLPKMRRIHEIRHPTFEQKVRYRYMYDTDEGAPVVMLPTTLSATYNIRYTLRHAQIVDDTDRLPIPREYLEMVTIGACQKLARRDRKGPLAAEFSAEYQRLVATMQRDQARKTNMSRSGFVPARIPFGYHGWSGYYR